MKQVDARGFSCPEPVWRTQQAMKTLGEGEPLEVLVETATSRENVRRMAKVKGYTVEIEPIEDGFKLMIVKR